VRQSGILTDAEIDELTSLGAVGDIALRFFDKHGAAIDHPVNDRIIGLELDQIRRIARVVGVAGGADKFEVIRAAVTGGLVNVLITDEQTGRRLLRASENATPVPARSAGRARSTRTVAAL
jgi:DNA-binding transcriptional regulator LsrR (DeoR family)